MDANSSSDTDKPNYTETQFDQPNPTSMLASTSKTPKRLPFAGYEYSVEDDSQLNQYFGDHKIKNFKKQERKRKRSRTVEEEMGFVQFHYTSTVHDRLGERLAEEGDWVLRKQTQLDGRPFSIKVGVSVLDSVLSGVKELRRPSKTTMKISPKTRHLVRQNHRLRKKLAQKRCRIRDLEDFIAFNTKSSKFFGESFFTEQSWLDDDRDSDRSYEERQRHRNF